MRPMDRTAALEFAEVARRLGAATRAAGLTVPVFRTPPRRSGVPRTIRRLPGGPVVAVVLRDRAFEVVVRDMVEGVVVANRLGGESATRIREALLRALVPPTVDGGPPGWRNRQTQAA